MADEQATAETTAEEDVQTTETTDQTTESEDTVSEDVKDTSEDTGSDKQGGDLRIALQEERRKRQQYEQALRDPNFIYQQARQLGLTEEEAEAAATGQTVAQPTYQQPDISALVEKQVNATLDYNEAVRLMPEVKSDPELAAWAASLVDSGKSHVDAVRIIQKRIGSVKQEAKVEGRQEAKTTISDKERAATATQTTNVDSDAAELEDLQRRSKSYDKRTQEDAVTELLLRKMRSKK